MLKECNQLLAGLEENLRLAQKIKAATRTDNLDVVHIGSAIQVVKDRIAYLTRQAHAAADQKKADDAAAALRKKQMDALIKLHGESSLDVLEASKASAKQLLSAVPDHAESLLQVEVLDKLIADKKAELAKTRATAKASILAEFKDAPIDVLKKQKDNAEKIPADDPKYEQAKLFADIIGEIITEKTIAATTAAAESAQ